jgi:hypothetical protein
MGGFQAGGTVRRDSIYIERRADRELPDSLSSGHLCYVLAPRQIGKSSLTARVAAKLRVGGVRSALIDLSSSGSSDTTQEQFYLGLLEELAEQLELPDPIEAWRSSAGRPPVQRWRSFLRNQVLEKLAQPIVIFLDEVDSMRTFPGWSGDFFAELRAAYNTRARDPLFERLTFCLSGVAEPTDLVRDTSRAPFNIGRRVELEDFTRGELDGFAEGLPVEPARAAMLLDAVHAWTRGHPYMTQRLCEHLSLERELASADPAALVASSVQTLFLERGRTEDVNLAPVEAFFGREHAGVRTARILALYDRVLDGARIPYNAENPDHTALFLGGMIAAERNENGAFLRVRNEIIRRVFDSAWVDDRRADRLLSRPLREWLGLQRPASSLLRERDLESARIWAAGRDDLTAEERDFIIESFAEALSEERRYTRATTLDSQGKQADLRAATRELEARLSAAGAWRWTALALLISLLLVTALFAHLLFWGRG